MRIVSLCPSLTELVFDLGRGDSLVGRTKFCVHPADRVEVVEKVGGTKNPKVERIIELAPDLVLMNEEENRLEDAEMLRAAGIACHTSMPRNALETAAMVRSIAAALGAEGEGERLAREIEEAREATRAAAADAEPVRYAYLIWRAPYMTVSDDTFVAGLLADAGGVNAFGSAGTRYPEITPEELRDADPDMVMLSSEPFPFAAKHAAELAELTGIPESRFELVDGELLSWHGSRTVHGMRYAGSVLGRAAV